jgi:alpha-methylacyl-CoA racemase
MGPLNGVKVVELASLAPAPFGTMVLADLGADVPQIQRSGGGGLSAPAGPLDRGKHTLALDLKDERDLAALHQVVEAADAAEEPGQHRVDIGVVAAQRGAVREVDPHRRE